MDKCVVYSFVRRQAEVGIFQRRMTRWRQAEVGGSPRSMRFSVLHAKSALKNPWPVLDCPELMFAIKNLILY